MENNQTPLEPKRESYMKHIIILSLCFFGIFFAFNTSQGLQSTVNKVQGYINLGCLYGVFSIFSIFGPKVVSVVGPKWSMIIGGAFYALVVASNLISNSAVQIIANCIVGVGAAMIWNAQGVYLGRCALRDSRTSSKSFAETTSSFNGIFFSIFQFSGMMGTLIGGIISSFGSKTTLFIVLTTVGAIAVLFLAFLPNVQAYAVAGQSEENKDTVSLSETLKLLVTSKKLLMMLPLIFYNGMNLAYIFTDISLNITRECFGQGWVLYVTAIFYGANAFFSFIWGKCIEKKWLSRSAMCCIAFICQMIYYIFIFIYFNRMPYSSSDVPPTYKTLDLVLCIIAVIVIAAGDSVWESQPPAILQSYYGKDQDRNAAMANFKMWQSLGFCAQFVIGAFLPDHKYFILKTAIITGLLCVGYTFLVILDKTFGKLDMKKGESAALLSGVTTN